MTSLIQIQPDAPADVQYRVCLVTTEFHGLFRNGGIGSANTALARALNAAGFDVTVAFANANEAGPRTTLGNFEELKAGYAAEGLTLDFIPIDPAAGADFDDPRGAALCVLTFLQRHSFEVVLFNDNGGLAYYALLAGKTRLLDPAPRFVLVAHGPVAWVTELNAVHYGGPLMMVTTFLERQCARLADVLVSPSRYLLGWMTQQGWTLPARTRVIHNVIGIDRPAPPIPPVTTTPITEIVFFGRLELRKGLVLFCDAIELLQRAISLAGVTVTFLGKFAMIAGNHAGITIAERARGWSSPVRLLASFDQREALAYLDRPGTLAVVASAAENSPCVVAECLLMGVPFLATETGGTGELVATEDHAACLFAPDPASLAARLRDALCHGHGAARFAVPPAQARADWLDLVSALAKEQRASRRAPLPAAERPLVSVCLAVAGPATARCLASALRQSYQPLEVLLAGEAPSPEILTGLDVGTTALDPTLDLRFLRVATPGRAAARNAAAQAATGGFLLFLDESRVTLHADCIARLVAAALAMPADLVTALPACPDRSQAGNTGPTTAERFPVGGCLPVGLLENCFGGGAVLARRELVGDGLAFPEHCDEAILDWHFLAAANLLGHVIGIVPSRLFDTTVAAPRDYDSGQTLRNHRHILRLHGRQSLETLYPIIEPLLQIGRQHRDRMMRVAGTAGAAAAELVRRLAGLDPASDEAHRVFCQYLLQRRQPVLALDFAVHNGVADIAGLVQEAGADNAALARQAIDRRQIDFWHELDLSEYIAGRTRMVAGSVLEVATVPAEPGVALTVAAALVVAKAAGLCPPGTGRLRLHVRAEEPAPNLAVAVILSPSAGRIRVAEDGTVAGEGIAGWSGWIPLDATATTTVAARVAPPAAGVLDVYLLVRRNADGPVGPNRVLWQAATASLIFTGPVSASAVELAVTATELPEAALDNGVLLTDVGGFALPVYVPGQPTLLHPIPGKIALVRLAAAVPAGAHGVRSVVAIGLPQSHPVQFAVWLRPCLADPLDPEALPEDEGWSGWFEVREPMLRHQFTATLHRPAETALDLYLATRVTGFDDVHYCHAHWHSIEVLTGGAAQPTPTRPPDQVAAAAEGRRNRRRVPRGTARDLTRSE